MQGYFSPQQALADAANFLQYIRRKLNCSETGRQLIFFDGGSRYIQMWPLTKSVGNIRVKKSLHECCQHFWAGIVFRNGTIFRPVKILSGDNRRWILPWFPERYDEASISRWEKTFAKSGLTICPRENCSKFTKTWCAFSNQSGFSNLKGIHGQGGR